MGYAAIYIPEFPALAWLRLEPGAAAKAAAVVEGVTPLERVVSFNRAAKALGLEHGMSKVRADTSGEVLFRARSMAEEQAALESVYQLCERFSPRVQIIASPVNGYGQTKQHAAMMLLDQSGTGTLFGDAKDFAVAVHRVFQEERFPANVAVAPNAEASLLLARSYGGATSVSENEVRTKLAPLAVSALRCAPAVLATLTRWGIRNLGELAVLPETALISRIGQQGKRLQRLALGTEDHLLVPENPAFVLAEKTILDSPLDSLESLLFIVSPMLETLLRQAMRHACALRQVTVVLELEKLAPHKLDVRPARPVQSREFLLKLLHLKLQAEPPQAGIVGVELSAEPAISQVVQRGLFQAQFPEPDKLDLLIARLRSVVGEGNVGSPMLVNSHREDEFQMAAFLPRADAEIQVKPACVAPALRRCRPLQPVRVVLRELIPCLLFWQGERLELGPVSGPWQSGGFWWDDRRWEADEWDAFVAQPPQALRLRHEPGPGTWYVAGQYD